MADVQPVLDATRDAVAELIAAADKAMNPASGPATPAEARIRLESALAQFDRACRACAGAGGTMASPAFGTVPVEDYARFIEVHTRHHCKQLPNRG